MNAVRGWSATVAMLVLSTASACSSRQDESSDRPQTALRRGVDWLLAQQAADGGWHSTTYGQMRGGVGNTALALYALAHSSDSLTDREREAVRRGLTFLLSNLDETGFVRAPDGSSDYPTYATALTLLAMKHLSIDDWPEKRRRMQQYLRAAQQTTAQGWTSDDSDFGGWNQTGGAELDLKYPGETNVSVTRFALEALLATDALDDKTRDAALAYLARCQNLDSNGAGDGGFFFTPDATDPRNKAGRVDPNNPMSAARSYRTATADGLRALLACGVPIDDRRVSAAIAWLRASPTVDQTADLPDDEQGRLLRRSLRFYDRASLVQLIASIPELESLGPKIIQATLAEQHSDGSWVNDAPLMHENDPLVATSFALIALIHNLRH